MGTSLGPVSLEGVFLDNIAALLRVVRRRVNSPDLANDLVQDIYMKCRLLKVDFPHHDDARAYLLRMAANLAIDHERVERRRDAIKEDLIAVFDAYDRHADSPEAYAIAADEIRLAELELARLPGLTRQMFVLAQVYGLTHKEVAERLGVSKSLVDKYIVHAISCCREALFPLRSTG